VIEQETLLIQNALQGDDHAFGLLVDAYQKPVFSLCYRMLGNCDDAEDASQESFIKAYQHLRRYDRNRSFATWLLSITAHHCIDLLRKRHLPTVSTDVLPAEVTPDRNAPNPEREQRDREKDEMIQSLLKELTPPDRAAVVLRYWYDYSEVEIGEALNLTVSAVKSRLYRSRKTLAKAWTTLEKVHSVTERKPHESSAI